ncbi:flagellar motor protein : Motility protein B, N-terminal domain protein OS=Gemmatimonadetes bacterium KBS708 GN=J421_0225 PE=4 SV=1: MotB_plug [Gemmata massiliana]|uniref:Motility protein B-like N-terminal domain-containing protein n=1 Tax=Gemmata massiliana TaxID=1210884 RepID=A0A6P2D5G1_9BACT|nr:flagellar motor protein MotB [Gemmata massiliana]VTR96379.1 flagellar motor protein : Motility protein B, N-terminal domain protein OS=Gemmatimonadetes bacterium KBS708 GN=J421_0225 PE=4 SV=1: MotB_plug [Gemmata massiliana]
MAKGGGGSWKVAYADFVTAMMAFFLVMWIGAQDVKVRQSVANYFVDPSGVSKRPTNAGAVLDAPVSGPVPENAKVEGGRGARAPGGDTPSPSTAAVLNWIKSNDKQFQRWKAEAQRCRESAAVQKAVNQTQTPEEVASNQLTSLLSTEVAGGIPKDTPDVYKDLLFGSFKEVNWKQVAEVLLTE